MRPRGTTCHAGAENHNERAGSEGRRWALATPGISGGCPESSSAGDSGGGLTGTPSSLQTG